MDGSVATAASFFQLNQRPLDLIQLCSIRYGGLAASPDDLATRPVALKRAESCPGECGWRAGYAGVELEHLPFNIGPFGADYAYGGGIVWASIKARQQSW
jgi:hypothetical protein